MGRNATYGFYKIWINSIFLIFFLIYLLFLSVQKLSLRILLTFKIKLQSESSIFKKEHCL